MTTAACPTDRSARSCVTLPPAQGLPLSATFYKLLRPIAIFPRPVTPICRHPYTSREVPPPARVYVNRFRSRIQRRRYTSHNGEWVCHVLFHSITSVVNVLHRTAMQCHVPHTPAPDAYQWKVLRLCLMCLPAGNQRGGVSCQIRGVSMTRLRLIERAQGDIVLRFTAELPAVRDHHPHTTQAKAQPVHASNPSCNPFCVAISPKNFRAQVTD